MINELEKHFFDTFGIEPKEEKYCYWECKKPELENVACNNTECEHYRHKIHYPQISDSILLKLICINEDEQPNIEWLKQCVLENLIRRFEKNIFCDKEQAVKQVRTLFEEG